jgi:hypothetical protein
MNTRLRTSGTDNTTANYFWNNTVSFSNSGPTRQGGVSQTSFTTGAAGQNSFGHEIIFFTPFTTSYRTIMVGSSMAMFGNSDFETSRYAGAFNLTTSFDSMSFIPNGGTITGSISCFGFNK